MKRLFFLIVLFLSCVMCFPSVFDVVNDDVNNALDESNSAERIAEEQTINRISRNLQDFNGRIQNVIDHINVVSRRVSSFVETADEVVETAETLKRGYEVFSRIGEEVPQMDFLPPAEQVRVINESIMIVEDMQSSFLKIEKISTERFAGFADMDDGERIGLLRMYLSYIRGCVFSLENLYDRLVQKGGGMKAFGQRYSSSMGAAVFGF